MEEAVVTLELKNRAQTKHQVSVLWNFIKQLLPIFKQLFKIINGEQGKTICDKYNYNIQTLLCNATYMTLLCS